MLQMNQVVKLFNLYEIWDRVFCAVPILAVLYLVLTLLMIPAIYLVYRGKEVY